MPPRDKQALKLMAWIVGVAVVYWGAMMVGAGAWRR